MKTIWLVYGTRPEVIKMALVAKAFKAYADKVNVVKVFTGQHRELATDLFADLDMAPHQYHDASGIDQPLWDLGAKCLIRLADFMKVGKPDLILVQGDTASAFFTALAAYFNQIPVGHVEAGLRTYDDYSPFPEEMMRRLIAPIAAYHFAPTETAYQNLWGENVDPSRIFVTGNTSIDAVWDAARVCNKRVRQDVDRWVCIFKPYVVVTMHRRESFNGGLRKVADTIAKFAKSNPKVRFWFSVHPNPNVAKQLQGDWPPNVEFMPPVDYFSMVYLIKNCLTVVTDSGGLQEEGPALGKRVLVAREVTERPEGLADDWSELVGFSPKKLAKALEDEIELGSDAPLTVAWDTPYGDGQAGERIADIVVSELCGTTRQTEDWKP